MKMITVYLLGILTGTLWTFIAMFTYKGYTGANLINIIIDTLGQAGIICMRLLPLIIIIFFIWFLTLVYQGGKHGKNR
jgi:hypothetical protein